MKKYLTQTICILVLVINGQFSNAQCTNGGSSGIDIDLDGYCSDVDCNDNNNAVHPGATEICGNGIDDNCDGLTDAYLPSGLKLYLPFNGNANDESGNNHNGTVTSSALSTGNTGSANTAYQFNGNTSRIEVADHSDLRPVSLTLSAWMYYSSVPSGIQSVVGKGLCNGWSDSYTFFFYNGSFYVGIGYGTVQIEQYFYAAPAAGQWHHVAMTFDDAANQTRVYIDNVLMGNYVSNNTIFYDNSPLEVGTDIDLCILNYYFNGKVDEVMLFDRALSAAEITQVYNATVPAETCNGIDDNCNGFIDEGLTTVYYADADGDGFGNAASSQAACTQPSGYVTNNTDCNDTPGSGAAIHPGATELINGIDDDCDGFIETLIAGAEYYFDADPGVGFGTSIAITTGGFSTIFSGNISIALLSPGFHRICVRTRDNRGHWALFEARSFYVLPTPTAGAANVVEAEYYFDSDPGVGNATAITITTGATANYSGVIPLSSLPVGFHKLCIRTQDNLGHWSLSEERTFYVYQIPTASTQIVEAEYFYDNDPGVGNATAINVTPASTLNYCGQINVPVLSPGTHNLIIRTKDNNGHWSLFEARAFTTTSTGVVSVTPAGPINICATSVLLTANITGGPYTYQWYQECNPINGATASTYSATGSGTYFVAVTSGSNSESSNRVSVNFTPPPTAYSVTGGGSYCSVPGTGVLVGLNHSENGVNYQLVLNSSTNVGSPVAGNAGNAITFNNQTTAGVYTVVATSGGCTSTMNDSATVSIIPATAWYQDADHDGYGNILVSQQSCTQPLNYVANNTDCDDTKNYVHPNAVELCNGIDDNCNNLIDENQFTISNVLTSIKCKGSNTGAIDVNINGGLPPFTYIWNNGNTNQDIANLFSGTYTITVTSGGCTSSSSFVITQPATVMSISLSKTTIRCGGKATGILTALPSGGGVSYTYIWTGGFTTATITGIAAGTYTVTITDNLGCTKTKTVQMTENTPQAVYISPAGPANQYMANRSGGVGPWTYNWNTNPLQASQIATIFSSGNYRVKVTDSKGCTVISSSYGVAKIDGSTVGENSVNDISVHPNPSNGFISISGFDCNNCNIKLSLTDVIGKLIYQSTEIVNDIHLEKDFSFLQKGIYMLMIETGDKRKTVKLVKE